MADDSLEDLSYEDISGSLTQTPIKDDSRPDGPKTPANQGSRYDAEEVREAALRRELEGVRNINQVIEGVISTLEGAKGDMGVCWIFPCMCRQRHSNLC